MFVLRKGGNSAKADLTRGFDPVSDDSRASALASALRSRRAAFQPLSLAFTGVDVPLEDADLIEGTAESDFHDGERRDPCAAATGGVPFPTFLTFSFFETRSGEGDLDDGWLVDQTEVLEGWTTPEIRYGFELLVDEVADIDVNVVAQADVLEVRDVGQHTTVVGWQ
ncbi:hypothetical protein P8C59_007559 [Phyllachora maydis]|uniref:Uncharacterized protein n=1 Tax=Phyllachora maydis TaxID=1825666 RepID=A0AAD9I8S6_9PEZI|nr:hypothetical protein P8C59_007559 [Phyllachora maydis]